MKRSGSSSGDHQRRLGSASLIRRARREAKHGRAVRSGTSSTASVEKRAARAPRTRRSKGEGLSGARRIWLVLGVFGLAAVGLVARAAQLQLVEGEVYGDAAERQATTSAQIKAKRGVILDRHGAELAISVDVDSVYAEPRRIQDPGLVARKLAPILGVSVAKLERKLNSKRAFTYLRRRVDASIAEKTRALALVGVGTHPEPKRFYSNVSLGAHVLGFTDFEGEGRAGIERAFDDRLRGKSFEVPGLRDALGNKVFSEGFVPHAVLEGADVRLTLDRQIQYASEVALEEAVTTYRARAGVVLVMEPQTGDILALASYPSFNPNNLGGTKPDDHLNRAISAIYEPGSTMKMVTIAAAMEEGLVRADSKIDCEGGRWRVGGRTIGDADHKFGELSVTEVLKVSSNICAAKIGFALGRDRVFDWLTRFGFGARTGVDLPGELGGIIRPVDTWRDIALANISFGQGIAVTPLQIVSAAATIANDGMRAAPRIVSEVVDKNGDVHPSERPEPIRVLSEQTAQAVTQMMVEVTTKGGTAMAAAVPGFDVAGKTGTAQKVDPVTRGYSHELYVASFVGFVPADRPEVAILVLIDEPKGSIFGGTVAAPAFKKIAMAALAAREVFPEDAVAREAFLAAHRAPPTATVPAAEAPDAEEKVMNSAQMAEVDPSARGDLSLEGALSADAQALLGIAAEGVIRPLKARGGAPKASSPGQMPNFAGLELREVLNRSAEVRCDPVIIGSGRVVSQLPSPGASVAPGSRCELKLAPKNGWAKERT